jgi:hypothetical protein
MKINSFMEFCLLPILLGLINPQVTLISYVTQDQTSYLFFPVVIHDNYTISRYMQTTDPNVLYLEGVNQVIPNGVIILNFGPPRIHDSEYGTFLFDYSSFKTVEEIETAVKAFIDGLWYGSQSEPLGYFIVAVGTTNCGNGQGVNDCNPGDNVTNDHGRAWAIMVNNIESYIISKNYSSKIHVAGAIDIEADWNTAQNTRNWIHGYVSNTSILYYNFGTCDGCPTTGEPQCNNNGGSINDDWTLEDIRYVSTGEPESWPFPEIYRTNGANAQQWFRTSVYSYICHNSIPLPFKGTMTTYNACVDRDDLEDCHNLGIDNKPIDGWNQLWQLIYSDTRTRISSMPYSTDISWQN